MANTTTSYAVGQKVWFKGQNGREFYAVIRAIHPHADLSDYYALDAVFADNCLDMPDNWAHARDLRAVEAEKVIDCPHCSGGVNPGLGYDGRGSCYCGNTGKLNLTVGACCTCGMVACRCEV